jgi:hypothetical protein
MFFARRGKQSGCKENSEDALANEGSHNALPQLSVSVVIRKDESAVIGRDRQVPESFGSDYEHEQEEEL